jgi:hypothetical protein
MESLSGPRDAANMTTFARRAQPEAVRERLLAGDRAVVQALRGMGRVGKTQLATAYAHRFDAAYDLAWWSTPSRAG